jgi:hypothetical protein
MSHASCRCSIPRHTFRYCEYLYNYTPVGNMCQQAGGNTDATALLGSRITSYEQVPGDASHHDDVGGKY